MRRIFTILAFCIAQTAVSPPGLWALARQVPTGETAFHTLGIRDGLRSTVKTALLLNSDRNN